MTVINMQPTLIFRAHGTMHVTDLNQPAAAIADRIAEHVRASVAHQRFDPIELALREVCTQTGFKTFDQQTNCITDGNVSANTMFGQIIRPRCEPGHDGTIGACQSFDLQQMRRFGRAGDWVLKTIAALPIAETERLAAYLFFVSNHGQRTTFGAFLVDRDQNLIARSPCNTAKREQALTSMIRTLTNQGWQSRKTVVSFVDGVPVAHTLSVAKALSAINCPHLLHADLKQEAV